MLVALLTLVVVNQGPARDTLVIRDVAVIDVARKLADLLILDASPLDAIDNSRRIHAVVANGRLFTRADLDQMLAQAAAAAR